ncbi:hypothetical protein CPB86DRAFT_797079 [Serendipita vermifera]|nr:hypothetical protein CPB86DRAFT_797079 [Serendipita vermifera]
MSDEWESHDFEELGRLLQKIRTLGLRSREAPAPIHNISFPSKSLLHLELSRICPFVFASSTFQTLVVLSLESCDAFLSRVAHDTVIIFPSLRYLLYSKAPGHVEWISAPNLYIFATRPEVPEVSALFFPLDYRFKTLLLQPKYVILELAFTEDPFVDAFLAASEEVVDLELVVNKWSHYSSIITKRLLKYFRDGAACPKLRNLMFTIRVNSPNQDLNVTSLQSIADKIFRKRRDSYHVATLESIRYKILEENPWFDSCHNGLGSFEELWDRGLRDGSEETWENERKRLLTRQGWNDLISEEELTNWQRKRKDLEGPKAQQ